MIEKNPMEDVFISRVGEIVTRIVKLESPFEEEQKELHKHLQKAQQMNWYYYQIEAVNALGILNAMHSQNPIEHFKEALAIAQKVDEPGQILRIINNIGTHYMLNREYSSAKFYYQQGLQISQTMNPRPISYLTLSGNLVQIAVWEKNFREAVSIGDEALSGANQISVARNRKTSYGRAVWHLRSFLLLAQLADRQDDKFLTNLKATEELGRQLDYPDVHNQVYHAFYQLLVKGDVEAYENLLQPRLESHEAMPNLSDLDCGLFLKNVGYPQQAYKLVLQAMASYTEADNSTQYQFILKLVKDIEAQLSQHK